MNLALYEYIYIYIYIHIKREGENYCCAISFDKQIYIYIERERDTHICIYIHMLETSEFSMIVKLLSIYIDVHI